MFENKSNQVKEINLGILRVVVTERIKFDDFLGVLSFLGDDILTEYNPNFSLKRMYTYSISISISESTNGQENKHTCNRMPTRNYQLWTKLNRVYQKELVSLQKNIISNLYILSNWIHHSIQHQELFPNDHANRLCDRHR